MPLAVIEVPAAASAHTPPPCPPDRGGRGMARRSTLHTEAHCTAPEKQELVFAGGERSALLMALESS